jgi:DNA replication and repair protein RecF
MQNVYNEQLTSYGTEVYLKRMEFLNEFIPLFKNRYLEIATDKENVDLKYKTQLEGAELMGLFQRSIERDRVLQYTSVGIHKDDLSFLIDDFPIKKFGSQGQQKSYLVALKLAQFDIIKAHSKIKPILLLDDIFDKLDDFRVSQIVNLVNKDEFGQLFISDTHKERTEEVVKKADQPYKIFEL